MKMEDNIFLQVSQKEQISEEDRIQLNIPMISWKNEPIKIELDIQARQYCTVLLINKLFL